MDHICTLLCILIHSFLLNYGDTKAWNAAIESDKRQLTVDIDNPLQRIQKAVDPEESGYQLEGGEGLAQIIQTCYTDPSSTMNPICLEVLKNKLSEEQYENVMNKLNYFVTEKPDRHNPFMNTGDNCTVSEWSSWGPCVRTPLCENEVEKHLKSYNKPQGRFDVGHATMNMMKKVKIEEDAAVEKCQDDGSCPELARRPSEGSATCIDGMAEIYPCRNIDQLAFLNLQDLGYSRNQSEAVDDHVYGANDVWGWTDPRDGQEYVIVGLSGGTSFLRITPDPTNPEVLGFLPTRSVPSLWRDIKVVNDHAFIVSEAHGHGMQVVDLTRLHDMSADSDRIITADANYSEFGNAHNIVSNPDTGYVYAVGALQMNVVEDRIFYPLHCSGGLHVIDVSEPKDPRFVSCYYEDGYTHDAQCVIYYGPDSEFYGREICFNYNEDTLTIVDVQDKHLMKTISRTSYERHAYTHQGWLTEDHTTIFMNDEVDEFKAEDMEHKYTRTLIWDVRSLSDPKLANEYVSGVQSIDHNLYTRGDFVYESNYEAGLRILHYNPDGYHLMEVAYFDVYPSDDTANFHGTWSNYPYFDSGVVPVTSKGEGLFLVMPHYKVMEAEGKAHSVYGEQRRTRQILETTNGNTCPRRVEVKPCEPATCS